VSPTSREITALEWRLMDGDINLAAVVPSVTTPFLTIPANTLTPGAKYRIRLQARYGNDASNSVFASAIGWAEVAFNVANAPWGGTCSITPTSGLADTTLFRIKCEGYEVNPLQFPLFFHYSILTSDNFDYFLSSHYVPSNEQLSFLPTSGYSLCASPIKYILTILQKLRSHGSRQNHRRSRECCGTYSQSTLPHRQCRGTCFYSSHSDTRCNSQHILLERSSSGSA
jgi:hypothetical protein